MTQWADIPAGSADQLAARVAEVIRGAAREGQAAVALDAAAGALDVPQPAQQPGWVRGVWAPLLQRLRSPQTAVLLVARGPVSGLGLALCLTADLCVCEENAMFSAGHVGALSGGVAWHLHQLGGPKLASRLLLARQRLSSQQAAHAGIVTEAVPPDTVRQAAENLLAPLQQGELGRLLLRSYRHANHLDLADSVAYDTQLAEVAHTGGEYR